MNSPFQPDVGDEKSAGPHGGGADALYLYYIFRQYLWIILVIMGISVLVATALYLRLPRVYPSTAVLQVEQFEQKVTEGVPFRQVNMMALDYTQSLTKSMHNPEVFLRVVKRLGLEKDPDFAPPRRDGKPYTDEELAAIMGAKITAELGEGTRLIDVTASDHDPERAKQIADTFIEEYLKFTYVQQLDVAKSAQVFLEAQAEKLKAQLEDSEQRLQHYEEQNNAVSLEETQNITVERLKDLNERVTGAKSDRLRLESDMEALKKLSKDDYDSILMIGSVAKLETVASARDALLKAQADFALIAKRYKYKHWKYIEADSEVDRLRKSLQETLSDAANILSKEYAVSLSTEQKLIESLKEQEKAALELNRVAIPYNVIAREVESDRKIYEDVNDRLRDMSVSESAQKPPFQVIQAPMISSVPSSPKILTIFPRSIGAGLVLCCGLIFVLNALDTSFHGIDEVEEVLEMPSLAVIPRLSRDSHTAENPRPIMLLEKNDSPVAEGFRTLRTSLSLLGPEEGRRVILVTSAIPAEGKSFCALNVATAFALEGKKTLLVDADLRRPTLQAALLNGKKNTAGLTEVLAGVAGVEKAIHGGPIDNLSLLPAGGRAPNPSELLASGVLPSILSELSSNYDRIIIDSAPIAAVSDTLLLCKHVQKVCMVVRVNKTPKKAVMRACRLVRKAGGDFAGVVLNRASTRHAGGYYYYSYSYEQKAAGAKG